MKPSILTFIILYPLVGAILFLPMVAGNDQAVHDGTVITIQGLALVSLLVVGFNAYDDFKDILKRLRL